MTVAPEGRKLLRVEARNQQTPIEDKPKWIKAKANIGPEFTELKSLVRNSKLNTVCEEAGCPNIFECWEDREATFLIGGEQCTRRCDFCQIDTGKPQELDRDEPRRVAESVAKMGLRYSTVTGVARDDLPDGGAWLYAETVRRIHALEHADGQGTGVELLIPDFQNRDDDLDEVFSSRPEVLGHNLETVPRIFRRIRPAFRYERSLEVLRDLHEAGTDLVTITQYLRPSSLHHPIDRWVKPQDFVELRDAALEIGFLGVMSGPLVRSSYRAGRLWAGAMRKRGQEIPAHLSHLDKEFPAKQEAQSVVDTFGAGEEVKF